jgi:hypothetical protein
MYKLRVHILPEGNVLVSEHDGGCRLLANPISAFGLNRKLRRCLVLRASLALVAAFR